VGAQTVFPLVSRPSLIGRGRSYWPIDVALSRKREMFSSSLHALSFPMRNDDVRMSNFLSNSKGFFLSIKSFPACLVVGLFPVSSVFGRRLVCSAKIQASFFRALQCVLVAAISVSVVLARFFPHFFFGLCFAVFWRNSDFPLQHSPIAFCNAEFGGFSSECAKNVA
jgi:hypothetical protein